MMTLDFVPLWTLILGFGVFMYVLMDGFDLGVGILFRRAPNDAARDIMMNSVAPIWDGNETWLVLGGVALLAAFPLAFAIILPAVYFPILIMLMALIFRGIAFELRFKASPQCALVFVAQYRAAKPRSDHIDLACPLGLAFNRPSCRISAFSRHNRAVHDGLSRARNQSLAEHCTPFGKSVGCGRRPSLAGVSPRRHAFSAAGNRRIYGVVLLGLPRQGSCRGGLSLV